MQVNMLEAKNALSRLVAAAERGEDVILARDGKPVARITVGYQAPTKVSRRVLDKAR